MEVQERLNPEHMVQVVVEVQAVQERFERLARAATGSSESDGNPFPLVFEGELLTP